jgi:5'-3' exonuclease
MAGIGPKGAASLIARHGKIEDFPPEVLGDRRELALLFKKLAILRTDAPLFTNVDKLQWRGPTTKFVDFAARFEDTRLVARATNALERARA